MAANPDDAEFLSLRGETLLNAGKRSEAVASFRRAYELEGNPRTRQLLRETLLDGLRTEFAAYRDRSGEVERLLDDLRAVCHVSSPDGRRFAAGGPVDAALEFYQKLIDLEPGRRPLDQVSKNIRRAARPLVPRPTCLLRNEANRARRPRSTRCSRRG